MARQISLGLCRTTVMIVMLAGSSTIAGPLIQTRWAAGVSADDVHREYPRPQMVRAAWVNLNGMWEYAVAPRGSARPREWTGRILVPFCIESAISGVGGTVGPDKELWYRRTFERPALSDGERVLLHFGAVDWRAEVWVNDRAVGLHEGGYDAFTFDVTDALVDGRNELVVRVWDPTDAGYQPRGKQVRRPHSIWYTSVTGIWQTLWMETVPRTSIRGLRITPDFGGNRVRVDVETRGDAPGCELVMEATIEGQPIRATAPIGSPLVLQPDWRIPAWSPSEPILHEFTIGLRDGKGNTVDEVGSYFGFRSIEVRKDGDGVNRLFLNGEALFQYGPLDQGWWPDGLYTAPSDEALRYDLEVTKRHGFNMVRKHVKVEPARWYYWCDRLGLLVWQDMPSGDEYISGDMPDISRSAQSGFNFERELRAMVDGLFNHPCIVVWVPYNEGWGQWDTRRIAELIKREDPTRLVDNASGWTDRGAGDLLDIHSYPAPRLPKLEDTRAAVVGEFGGLGLPVEGHLRQAKDNWGYRTYPSPKALTDAYVEMLGGLHRLIGRGLAAAVYTQTTDVEIEVNGLMTYDREIIKLDEARAAEAARRLFTPAPRVETIVPTSGESGATWRYTMMKPSGDWSSPTFDDGGWSVGKGGFGTDFTPGAQVGTTWDGKDIWIRRAFELDAIPSNVELEIHHDEDAEVYVNGVCVARLSGYVTGYVTMPFDGDTGSALRAGRNVMAIHCRNTTGGQFIDAGLVSVE